MVYEGIITGKYIDLKSCTEEDAEFTLELRNDPELGKFFPRIHNSLEQQKAWIRSQREKPGDYFFVVWNKNNERKGTIGIYNIQEDRGEGGRIIFRDSDPYEVSEAQLLIDRFAFDVLGLKTVTGEVFAENTKAIRFSSKFSGRLSEPEINAKGERIVRVETTAEEFAAIEQKISKLLYKQK